MTRIRFRREAVSAVALFALLGTALGVAVHAAYRVLTETPIVDLRL